MTEFLAEYWFLIVIYGSLVIWNVTEQGMMAKQRKRIEETCRLAKAVDRVQHPGANTH